MKAFVLKHISKTLRLFVLVLVVILMDKSSAGAFTKVTYESSNRTLDLTSMAMRVQEVVANDLYASIDTYSGDLTAYVFNCPLCNGTLGCLRSYDITDGTYTYDDEMYGTVRIVASSRLIPCGSIIRFNSPRISDEPIIAIVLDRGVLGNDLDILAGSIEDAFQIGRSVVTYDILRTGWER